MNFKVESITALFSAAAVIPFLPPNSNGYCHPLLSTGFFLGLGTLTQWVGQQNVKERLEFCGRLLLAFDYDYNLGTLIHELGHAWVMLAVYKNAYPQITIFPCRTIEGIVGTAAHNFRGTPELTTLGAFLGESAADAVVRAAGGVLDIFHSCMCLLVAQWMCADHPGVRTYLRMIVLVSVCSSVVYAFSALEDCTHKNSGHDFCRLKEDHAISPFLAMGVMMGIPLILQLWLSNMTFNGFNSRRTQHGSRVEEVVEDEERANLRLGGI